MLEVTQIDLDIIQGATFRRTIHWYGAGLVCAVIEDITTGYPTSIQVTGHGLPTTSQTPIWIDDVRGAVSLNTDGDSTRATFVDVNNFTVKRSTNGETWVSGSGVITYYAPTDLTGYTARMQIRTTKGATSTIADLTSQAGDLILSSSDGGIEIYIPHTDTEVMDFTNAIYDLEAIDAADTGDVTRVAWGYITLNKEVTR